MRCDGKIGGKGLAGDKGVARGVQRYARAHIGFASAEVGGIEQGRAGGIQLAHEGIDSPGESRLEGARGGGEIGGKGLAGDIGGDQRIEHYGKTLVSVTSAQIGGVDQTRAGGVQLADKGIERGIRWASLEGGLEGTGSGGEMGRQRIPNDVGVSRRIDRYA